MSGIDLPLLALNEIFGGGEEGDSAPSGLLQEQFEQVDLDRGLLASFTEEFGAEEGRRLQSVSKRTKTTGGRETGSDFVFDQRVGAEGKEATALFAKFEEFKRQVGEEEIAFQKAVIEKDKLEADFPGRQATILSEPVAVGRTVLG